jgi:hypothetical protein
MVLCAIDDFPLEFTSCIRRGVPALALAFSFSMLDKGTRTEGLVGLIWHLSHLCGLQHCFYAGDDCLIVSCNFDIIGSSSHVPLPLLAFSTASSSA